VVAALTACGGSTPPLQTAEPGVIFTFPIEGQLDVPLGARIVVTFSDPVEASALGACSGTAESVTGGFCLVGPGGPVDAMAEVSEDGKTVSFAAPPLEAGTTYGVHVGAALSPTAKNVPATGPLFRFTTRSVRPRAAAPTLIAVNGGDPTKVGDSFRPMFETTTLRLVFSEPLDPRGVVLAAGSVELVNTTTSTTIPAAVYASGIHVAIDPVEDLTPGETYTVRLGNRIVDLGGQPLAPTAFTFMPKNSGGATPIKQVLRTRHDGDPGPRTSRAGAVRNQIVMDKPLIGRETSEMLPSSLAAELGDPKALGGPIAFTIRRGQRMKAAGLDIKLGGQIPVGLSTGDIEIEILTDAGGRLYRNPYQPAEQRPENARAPLYADLSMDLAVYTTDPTGNAVITQTVLGVQATGTALATDGVLAIENVVSMELGLLGVTEASTNMVLELITDEAATVTPDTTPPTLIASAPSVGTNDQPVDAGIELIFSEPVDVERLRAGGLRLEQGTTVLPSVIESHGAAVVVRPLAPLAYSTLYRVVLADVADVAGNQIADASTVSFSTPTLAGTNAPMTVTAIHPGAPCALTAGSATAPGRCTGGLDSDALYQPFALPANQPVEVTFSQSPRKSSVVRGTACNTGAVRVEEIDAAGTCLAAVPGTLRQRDRSLAFFPDQPWAAGTRYRVTLVSGGNGSCDAGELCGNNNVAPSFDPLNGTDNGGAGGPNLVITFTGGPPSTATYMMTGAGPFTDVNGNGNRDTGEPTRDENRAALRIIDTTGSISAARFDEPDCVPTIDGTQACMYLNGAMPVLMGEVTTTCPLPDGSSAASCMPVTLTPQAMYATNLDMTATAIINIGTSTGTSVMRIREPAQGPITGYIIDRGGTPMLVVALDLYMDAPDMSVALSSHDLHSKPLAVALEGPVTFQPDGRIAIAVANTADLPVDVAIDAPLGIAGTVRMVVPRGEMKLQLVSPPLRGVSL